jgi:hypothetical protein
MTTDSVAQEHCEDRNGETVVDITAGHDFVDIAKSSEGIAVFCCSSLKLSKMKDRTIHISKLCV